MEATVCVLLALLLASWLRPRQPGTGGQAQKASVPRVQEPPTSATPQKSQGLSTQAIAKAKCRKDSAPWWLPPCCTGRGSKAPGEATKHADSVGGPGGGVLDPKWCGLRLRGSSERLPSCEAFSPERPDAALLNDWAGLHCGRDEQSRCQELAERVRHVEGPKDAMTLLRFLRARKQDVRHAAEQYTAGMKWREGNPLVKGLQLGTADASLASLHRRFDRYWQLNGLLGRDRDGDGICWEGVGRSILDQSSLLPDTFFLDHQVHSAVRLQQALDEQTKLHGRPHMYFTAVVDLHGMGVRHLNWDAARKYQKCVRLNQDYFPEVLKRIIIVRAPGIFAAIWKVFQHFFDEGMRDKMVVLGEREMHAGLVKYIDKAWIPESLGGELRVCGSPDCFPLLPPGRCLIPQELIDEINALYPGGAD